jgi:hypothetical protein
MIKLLDLLNEDENKDEPKQDIETFNRVIPVFPNFAKQIKRDNPKIITDHNATVPFTTTDGRLNLNSISGIKYDMGGEDLTSVYSPDKNIFEINYYGPSNIYYYGGGGQPESEFSPDEHAQEAIIRDKELKKAGFGGFINADLTKPHTFPKANGINITNTINYFNSSPLTVAKTIDNSLNSGGLLLIWERLDIIEKMSPVLSSYKIIAVYPLFLSEIETFDDINKDGFWGDQVIVVYRK